MSDRNQSWLEQYPDEIPATIDYPDTILPYFLEEAYRVKPNQVAIKFQGKSLLYQEVYEQALALANGLRSLGVQTGDRVALMLPNCPQAVIGYYAILMAGAVVVPTNPLYVERELELLLKDSGAKVIIGLDLVYPKISHVEASTPLEHIIITSIKDYLPFPKNLLYPFVQKKQGTFVDIQYGNHIYSFTKLLKSHPPKPIPVEREPDDLAVLQYTGGTTGNPKGVMLSHRNLVVNTYQCSHWWYKSEYGKEKVLAIVPFFHVYGMTVVMNFGVLMAATLILIPRFEAKDVLKTIHREKPSIFPGAPTIYIGLLNDPELSQYDLSSIKACLSGSAPLPVDVQKRFEQVSRGKLVEGYGLTEASPVTHANLIWGQNMIGSIGLPWPDTEAKIVSLDTREELPPGQIGELAVKGPQVMQGYWNKPEETAKALKDGWLMTGDLGYMDKKGYFYIVDRKKDMIIAGGYNIYPREIEEVLYEHWGVQECVVIGISDPYRGETVKAYIVKKEDRVLTIEELDSYCREKLAAYKVPKIYEFRDELPKSMVGKILKRVLVEEEQQKLNKLKADAEQRDKQAAGQEETDRGAREAADEEKVGIGKGVEVEEGAEVEKVGTGERVGAEVEVEKVGIGEREEVEAEEKKAGIGERVEAEIEEKTVEAEGNDEVENQETVQEAVQDQGQDQEK